MSRPAISAHYLADEAATVTALHPRFEQAQAGW